MQLRTSEKGTNLLTHPRSQEIKKRWEQCIFAGKTFSAMSKGLASPKKIRWITVKNPFDCLCSGCSEGPCQWRTSRIHWDSCWKRCIFTAQQWKRIWEASKSAACRSNSLQRGLHLQVAMHPNHWAPPASPKSAPFHLKVNTVATASSNKSTMVWAVATRIRTLRQEVCEVYPFRLSFCHLFLMSICFTKIHSGRLLQVSMAHSSPSNLGGRKCVPSSNPVKVYHTGVKCQSASWAPRSQPVLQYYGKWSLKYRGFQLEVTLLWWVMRHLAISILLLTCPDSMKNISKSHRYYLTQVSPRTVQPLKDDQLLSMKKSNNGHRRKWKYFD